MAAVIAVAAFGLASCGGNGDRGDEAAGMRGDTQAGREIFTARADPVCGSCHTLEDAGSLNAVRTGPGIMPSYSDQLSDDEIEDVAAYVSDAAAG
jgi:mono/diheme cytochrome c family protein